MTEPSAHGNGRRLKSAKARNRGKQGTHGQVVAPLTIALAGAS
jgi:hypothetical protein